MLILEPGNRVMADLIRTVVFPEKDKKVQPFKMSVCDFDGANLSIELKQEEKDTLFLSCSIPCFSEVENMGTMDYVNKAYPNLVMDKPAPGFNVTLKIPKTYWEGNEEKAIDHLSQLRKYVLGGVFEKYYSAVSAGTTASLQPFKLNMRPDTVVYFLPSADRVTTIYQLTFEDRSDREIGRVFLKEFADPQIRRSVQRAPLVQFDVNPPEELVKLNFNPPRAGSVLGYVSFQLLPIHTDAAHLDKAVANMQTFRTLVQYHLKAAKTFFHSSMRTRVADLVKVLNRAKTKDETAQPKRIISVTGKVVIGR